MPDLGQLRNLDGQCHVFMRCYARRRPEGPMVTRWVDVTHFGGSLPDEIRALPHGTVIDLEALARREVVVIGEPGARLDDETLEALLAEADAMGGER